MVSDIFPPIPSRLVQQIRRWEFIELNQVLPDNLVQQPTIDPDFGDSSKKRDKKKLPPITDMCSWSLAMLLYAATIHAAYPHKTGEILVYIATIMQTSMSYPADACLAYDRIFRAQAHLKPEFNWAGDNTRLWNDKFSGRAKPKSCATCNSQLHRTAECTFTTEQSKASTPASQNAIPHTFQGPSATHHQKQEICMGFNLGRCSLAQCPRTHLCYRCNQAHALLQCPKAKPFIRHKAIFSNNTAQHPRPPRPSVWRSSRDQPQ